MPNTEAAQIKAKELIEKFKEMICCSTNHCTYGSIKEDYEYDMNLAAKQCAIICVEEILKEIMPIGARNGHETNRENFYQQVLTNINNLK